MKESESSEEWSPHGPWQRTPPPTNKSSNRSYANSFVRSLSVCLVYITIANVTDAKCRHNWIHCCHRSELNRRLRKEKKERIECDDDDGGEKRPNWICVIFNVFYVCVIVMVWAIRKRRQTERMVVNERGIQTFISHCVAYTQRMCSWLVTRCRSFRFLGHFTL